MSRLKEIADAVAAYHPQHEVGVIYADGPPCFVVREQGPSWACRAWPVEQATFIYLADGYGIRRALEVLAEAETALQTAISEEGVTEEDRVCADCYNVLKGRGGLS